MGEIGGSFRWFGKKVFCFCFWREFFGQMGPKVKFLFCLFDASFCLDLEIRYCVYICCDISVYIPYIHSLPFDAKCRFSPGTNLSSKIVSQNFGLLPKAAKTCHWRLHVLEKP